MKLAEYGSRGSRRRNLAAKPVAWTPGTPRDDPQDFVEFVEETAALFAEFPQEAVIRQAWDWDSQSRRDGIPGGYVAFRQHVMNLVDAGQAASTS